MNERRRLSSFERSMSPVIEEKVTNDEPNPLELGDEAYLAGNLDEAAKYYTLAMEKEASSSLDINNNEETTELSWSKSLISRKLIDADLKIEMNPGVASYYLEKASLLFFENKWSDARTVLATALSNCSEKSEIRNTIGNLNKVERTMAVGIA